MESPPAPTAEAVLPELPSASGPVLGPVFGAPGAPVAQASGIYTFERRNVPPPPFGNSPSDPDGLRIAVDQVTNSWLFRGPWPDVEQAKRMASALDQAQAEIDLDFVLLAVSEDVVKSWGFGVQFREGASWLSALGLEYSGATLTIASGDWSFTADLRDASSGVRLLSSPVVRCMTGEPFNFATDQQVPVESLSRSEGVVTSAFEYRPIGLGLSGVVRQAGDRFRLQLLQRNGAVDALAETTEGQPPTLREQQLETVLQLELDRWACAGGVRSWRDESGKGLLGRRKDESQDLLLVFVRPRVSLASSPAWPAGRPDLDPALTDLGPLPGPDGSLLPPRPASPEEEERELIEEQSRKRSVLGAPHRR